jgi:hypothetical protein
MDHPSAGTPSLKKCEGGPVENDGFKEVTQDVVVGLVIGTVGGVVVEWGYRGHGGIWD